jgi:hypothetical protein
MVLLHSRLGCARHESWDVVWVCDVSSLSYGRMDKEPSEFIADKKLRSYVPNILPETKITLNLFLILRFERTQVY